jgi:hypothetical protein
MNTREKRENGKQRDRERERGRDKGEIRGRQGRGSRENEPHPSFRDAPARRPADPAPRPVFHPIGPPVGLSEARGGLSRDGERVEIRYKL